MESCAVQGGCFRLYLLHHQCVCVCVYDKNVAALDDYHGEFRAGVALSEVGMIFGKQYSVACALSGLLWQSIMRVHIIEDKSIKANFVHEFDIGRAKT